MLLACSGPRDSQNCRDETSSHRTDSVMSLTQQYLFIVCYRRPPPGVLVMPEQVRPERNVDVLRIQSQSNLRWWTTVKKKKKKIGRLKKEGSGHMSTSDILGHPEVLLRKRHVAFITVSMAFSLGSTHKTPRMKLSQRPRKQYISQ